jgi:peptidoglycan hydrolase-like protein with peptidoglycan-binding domain
MKTLTQKNKRIAANREARVKSWLRGLSVALCLSIFSLTGAAQALEQGDRGVEVTRVQNLLISEGYYNGPVTGYYDLLTEEAIKSFQRDRNLEPTGIVNLDTLEALRNTPDNRDYPGLLRQGDRGSHVINLQSWLKVLGYYDGPATGYYGSLTEAAVRRFQDQENLAVDGLVGPNTWSTLMQRLPTG